MSHVISTILSFSLVVLFDRSIESFFNIYATLARTVNVSCDMAQRLSQSRLF